MATGLVAIVGGLALVLGTFQLLGNVHGPFTTQRKATEALARADVARILALKKQDTDRDGLSDYDELYVYHTSPYLADSDSDGIPDGVEVKNGTDPNCPQGKTCGGVTSGNTNTANGNTNGLPPVLAGTLSAAELRQLLAASGAPQTVLDATSDADLLTLYRQTLATTNVNEALNVNLPSNTSNSNVALNINGVSSSDLQQLSPAAIRQLLIQNGVDATTLSSVDDATLQSIFLQALTDVQTNSNANTNS